MDTMRTALLAPALALLLPLLACGGGGGAPGSPAAGDPLPSPNLPPRVAIPLSSINASADGGTSTHNVNPGAFADPEGDPLTVTAD